MNDPLFDRVAGLALHAAATERACRRANAGPPEAGRTGQPCEAEASSGAEGGAGAGSGGSARPPRTIAGGRRGVGRGPVVSTPSG